MNIKMHYNNPEQETKRFSKRGMICAGIVSFIVLLLLSRLIYLQVFENHFYTTLSKKNIINIIPVKATRGLIFDRNGIILAKNIPIYSATLTPGQNSESIKQTLNDLKPILDLSDDDIDAFEKKLKFYRHFQEIPLKNNLNESELDRFYVNKYRFPGINIQTDQMRQYPFADTMSSVLGYVGPINQTELALHENDNYTASDYIGKRGVELENESELHGKTGAKIAEINASGKVVRILNETKATTGKSIYLTIDSKLQSFAKSEMGSKNGAVIAIDPKNGEILALVSNPTYDPNLFVSGILNKDYEKLLKDPNHPLINRAIRGLYAPGSTVKPFISAYALNEGIITPNTTIKDPGWYRVPNTRHIFHDWKYNGHDLVNVYKAIVVSCDTFFYELADKLGVKRLNTALYDFGFGQKTGIDLPGERQGNVPTPEWKMAYRGHPWYTGDTIQSGIGQGYMLSTPLQLAYATTILAEHGKKAKPHLLLNQKIEQPEQLNYTDPNSWHIPIAGMNGVIMSQLGTAWIFGKDAPFSVAAKTGTAQVYGHSRNEELIRQNLPKKLRNNHLFIAFAPVDNPKIALAVVVEHDAFADLIARKILDFYFKELKDAKNKS